MDTVRVGFIGLGMRGPGAVVRFTHIPGIQIKALCDIRQECVEKAQNILKEAGLPEAMTYYGDENSWKQLCERDDIDIGGDLEFDKYFRKNPQTLYATGKLCI